MKRLVFVAAMFAGLVLGQPGNWSQGFEAKYGTPVPAEQARLRAEAADSAYRQDTTRQRAPENWSEQWFRAKYGRPSPAEEARLRDAMANTAFRQDTSSTAPDSDAWLRGYMKAKYGRDLQQR